MDGENRNARPEGFKPMPKPVKPAPPKRGMPGTDERAAHEGETGGATNERQPRDAEGIPVKHEKIVLPPRHPYFNNQNQNVDPDDFELPDRARYKAGQPAAKPPQNGSRGGMRPSSGQPPKRGGARQRDVTFIQAIGIFIGRIFGGNRGKARNGGLQLSRWVGAAAVGIIALAMIILAIWSVTNKNAYAVYIDKRLVGYVAKAADITGESIFAKSKSNLEASLGARVVVNEEISIEPAHASRKNVSPFMDLIAEIGRNFTYKIEATAIYVEGSEVIILKTEEDAKAVERFLTGPFVLDADGITYVDVSFVEDFALIKKLVDEGELGTVEEAKTLLDKTNRALADYTVVSGDMLGGIARRHNTTIDKICENNPGLNSESILQIGQVIKLETVKPFLSVRTIEEAVRKEAIPMSVRTEENPSENTAYLKTLQDGKDGEREITVRIVRVNGVQIGGEEIINTRTTVEPVDRVVEIGTAEAATERR